MLGVTLFRHTFKPNTIVVNLLVRWHIFKNNYYSYNSRKIVLEKYNIQFLRKITESKQYKTVIKDQDNSSENNSKRNIIRLLNFQSRDDALPFYNLPIKSLLQIYKTTKNDESKGFCENRLYYLSSRLKFPPSVLSHLVAKRSFIYTMSFEWLENSLNVLLEFKVPADRIIRDFWVLKYHHKTISERLLRVKESGIENLYPWMVRCSEDILNRFIALSQETKSILGDTKSAKLYLANRLNTSPEYIDEIYIKIPALKCVRVPKVKKFLDYLINEGFHVEDIASKPRVLITSQNTVKIRLDRLRDLGLKEINLNVLCKSRKDFQKYCDLIESLKPSRPNK